MIAQECEVRVRVCPFVYLAFGTAFRAIVDKQITLEDL
jgi:hypothetical protein